MGYTTDFHGEFKLNKPLDPQTKAYLHKFNETRRMKRKLPPQFGIDGEFYVDGKGSFGQDRDPNILDYNTPPSTQPGLWCHWCPNEDGTAIVWDEGEKFYYYVEWLEYIIKNFLAPVDYVLNGDVTYQGEDSEDFGIIRVKDNVVTNLAGRRVIEGENDFSVSFDHEAWYDILSGLDYAVTYARGERKKEFEQLQETLRDKLKPICIVKGK